MSVEVALGLGHVQAHVPRPVLKQLYPKGSLFEKPSCRLSGSRGVTYRSDYQDGVYWWIVVTHAGMTGMVLKDLVV